MNSPVTMPNVPSPGSFVSAPAMTALAPSRLPDLPVSIVFALVYFTCATFMIRRLLQSRRAFILGGLLVGLCMSRVVTFSLRAAWSAHTDNRNLGIAATILVSAGVILLVIVDMQLVVRLVKTKRPELQQNKRFNHITTGIQLLMLPLLIMTVAPGVLNILTTSASVRSQVQPVLKFSSTYLAIYSALPIFLSPLVAAFVPYSPLSIANRRMLPFKAAFISYISLLCSLELILRCAGLYNPTAMAWYSQSRISFYLLTPLLELLAIVPILILDLPHTFGDSNKAVLQAIWNRSQRLPEPEFQQKHSRSSSAVSASDANNAAADAQPAVLSVQEALQAISPNYTPGRWTIMLDATYGPQRHTTTEDDIPEKEEA